MVFGNAVYIYLDVGFVQMLKAITPVYMLFGMALFRVERVSFNVAMCVVLMTVGGISTTVATAGWTWMGLFLSNMASITETVRLVLTQHLLTTCKLSVVEGHYFLAPVTCVWLLLAGACAEMPIAAQNNALQIIENEPFLFVRVTVLGVAVNYLTYFVIQDVGSLTLKVLGSLRTIGLIVYSAAFYGETVTLGQMVAYFFTLVGFMGYAHYRDASSAGKNKSKPENSDE